MEIIPAIDIRGGRCVRLLQGDYGRETVFADDPAFESDIITWCQKVGHTLVEFKQEGTDFVALIEKR